MFRAREHFRSRPRHYRDRQGSFRNPDTYSQTFGFAECEVESLIEKLDPFLQPNRASNRALSPRERLLLTLRYLRTGASLTTVGDANGASSATAHRIIRRTVEGICTLANEEIFWPTDETELKLIEFGFRSISGLRLILGAIDGCHISMRKPIVQNAPDFLNRHGNYSVNMMGVVDAYGKFLFIDASNPGGCHDANVYKNSVLYNSAKTNGLPLGCVLVADSAYGLNSFTVPVMRNPRTPAEISLNQRLSSSRSSVERAFGMLKRMFGVLSKRIESSDPTFVSHITTACIVLYNILKRTRPHGRQQRLDISRFPTNDYRLPTIVPLLNVPPANIENVIGRQKRSLMST